VTQKHQKCKKPNNGDRYAMLMPIRLLMMQGVYIFCSGVVLFGERRATLVVFFVYFATLQGAFLSG
jgi:hypothetical protein